MRTTPPIHPGEILHEEFMVPLGLTANRLARHMGVPANRVTAIVNGQRGITAESALLLGRTFDTSAQFWMNLQDQYELEMAASQIGKRIEEVGKIAATV